MDINKLKSARSAKFHALDVIAKKLDRATIEDADDLLLFEELKSDLGSLDAQIRKLQDAERRAVAAIPVPYDPHHSSQTQPRRNFNVRSFASPHIAQAKFRQRSAVQRFRYSAELSV
jgi:hypothetical protein